MSGDIQALKTGLAVAVEEADLPPMLRNLLRTALVELSLWQQGASERGLRVAAHALKEWQYWREAGRPSVEPF